MYNSYKYEFTIHINMNLQCRVYLVPDISENRGQEGKGHDQLHSYEAVRHQYAYINMNLHKIHINMNLQTYTHEFTIHINMNLQFI